MIVFSNPGTIDVRCITVQGINVKPNGATAIGIFGTGLKIAIAVLLRTGHTVKIYSGADTIYEFTTHTDTVRGKEFTFIEMHQSNSLGTPDYSKTQKLGFTTDFGKHWETWMAYRELYSNCLDEEGCVIDLFDAPYDSAPDHTSIVVSGPEIDTIHQYRGNYFLFTEPLWENDEIAVHPVQDGSVFYRGILAAKVEPAPAFAYNIKTKAALTEDRTFSNIYDIKNRIGKALTQCPNEDLLSQALAGGKFEFGLDYNWIGTDLGTAIEELAWKRIKNKDSIPSSLRDALRRMRGADFDKEATVVPDTLAAMILHEPEVEKRTSSHSSIFSGIYAMEAEIDELRKQNLYWKACVEKLAEQENPPVVHHVTGKAQMAGENEVARFETVDDLMKDLNDDSEAETTALYPHEWETSALGHGETQCIHCFATNREISVIGDLNHCTERAKKEAQGSE